MAVLGRKGALVVGELPHPARGGFVLRTLDGGRSWQREDFDVPLQVVEHVAGQTLWATGSGLAPGVPFNTAGLFMTHDGGRRWQRVRSLAGTTHDNSGSFSPVVFVTPMWGFVREMVGGRQDWFETTDGGAIWMPVDEARIPLAFEAAGRAGAQGSTTWPTPSQGWAIDAGRYGLVRFHAGNDVFTASLVE
jgi:photosystem II stability/assembly factor-like uncharacterized protein